MRLHEDGNYSAHGVRYMSYYNSVLLDEIHRLFPAILYDETQFRNNDLVQYIRRRMREVYNVYDSAAASYVAATMREQRSQARPNTVRSYFDAATMERGPTGTSATATATATATQDTSYDTLTAILGLLSLPTAAGEASLSFSPLGSGSGLFMTPPIARQRTPHQDQSWAEILSSFMNPIPIRPTQEQITAGTRLFTTDAESTRDSCAICFDAISTGQAQRVLRGCDHAFHRECIDRHFQTSPRCPLCRNDVRDVASLAAAAAAPPPASAEAPTSNSDVQ